MGLKLCLFSGFLLKASQRISSSSRVVVVVVGHGVDPELDESDN